MKDVVSLKRHLLLRMVCFLAVLVSVSVASYWLVTQIVENEQCDMQEVNIVARQRQLVQQFSRQINLAVIGLSTGDWELLIAQRTESGKTAQMMTKIHSTLALGGHDPFSGQIYIPRMQDRQLILHQRAVEQLWNELKNLSLCVLRSNNSDLLKHPQLHLMQEKSDQLVAAVDDTLILMQLRCAERSRVLRVYHLLIACGGVFVFASMLWFVYSRIICPLANSILELQSSERRQLAIQADLAKAMEAAEAANRAKSRFVAGMSHEIRTPLNGVIGMSDLLSRTPLTAEQKELVHSIVTSGDALLDLINEILDFSKIEAGKQEVTAGEFDVHALIEDTADLLAPITRKKNVAMMSLIAQNVPRIVIGDQGKLRQVLLNLLGNASKFTNQGEVLIEVEAGESYGKAVVYIAVSDTGIGMKKEVIDRLFNPFCQADDNTALIYGGTGLGLSISKRLIGLMGGDIKVESVEGRGSKFSFFLPLELPEKQSISAVSSALAGKRILLVSDSEVSKRVIGGYANKFQMSCVVLAPLQICNNTFSEIGQNSPYEFIVADVNSQSDLDKIAQYANRLPYLKDAKLIQLSLSSTSEINQSNNAGLLSKPVKVERFLACLEQCLTCPGERSYEPASSLISPVVPYRTHENKLVLVVDDHPTNRKLAVLQLQEYGCTAHTASNGLEAIAAIRSQTYAMVLMDCQMPEMDGFDATRAVREHERTQELETRVPIIAMTAQGMSEDRELCLSAGMDDYVSKPVTSKRIEEVLRRWVPVECSAEYPLSTETTLEITTPHGAAQLEEWKLAFGDDSAMELWQELLASVQTGLSELQAQLDQGNASAAKDAAHRLKGLCLNLDDEGSSLNQQIEYALAKEDWNSARLHFSVLKRKCEIC